MGVIRQRPRTRLIDQLTLDDYVLDDESDSEVENDTNNNNATFPEESVNGGHEVLTPRRRRQRDGRTTRRALRIQDSIAGNVNTKKKERMGARKQRRYENARLLYASVDPNDICEDYSDILQSTVTALSKLFTERQNMEAWNSFIEKDEEEQREFLESLEAEEAHEQCCSFDDPSPRGAGVFGHQTHCRSSRLLMNFHFKCTGENTDHSTFSAEASFARLDRRFRMILRQKTLPLEFVAESEEELREFFRNNMFPKSEWSSSVLPGFQRLMLHALSQYLRLFSRSVAVGDGGGDDKLVKVRNKCFSFKPPPETLVQYLKRIRGSAANAENAVVS